ncbi:hypothetical protein L5515_016061 [Caenorhabditis briggsae]|uniref:Uncharacterized protein n=1 Tax=Caenorhabditis briggsae TaxID=6238 RepID=A0AAE9JPE1_CAEBR|nr:hypothetical protein L5515_016061 [Caenorhabditis briggsae]
MRDAGKERSDENDDDRNREDRQKIARDGKEEEGWKCMKTTNAIRGGGRLTKEILNLPAARTLHRRIYKKRTIVHIKRGIDFECNHLGRYIAAVHNKSWIIFVKAAVKGVGQDGALISPFHSFIHAVRVLDLNKRDGTLISVCCLCKGSNMEVEEIYVEDIIADYSLIKTNIHVIYEEFKDSIIAHRSYRRRAVIRNHHGLLCVQFGEKYTGMIHMLNTFCRHIGWTDKQKDEKLLRPSVDFFLGLEEDICKNHYIVALC